MNLIKIKLENLILRPYDLLKNDWMLLTSGDFQKNHFNSMTIAWGSIGCMWNKPFIQVVVRPTRYTFEFMEKYDSFTCCVFPEKYKSSLTLLGTKSGRNSEKIKESGLTIIKSEIVSAPSFKEAELIFECRKIYFDNIKPTNFIDDAIDQNYSNKDYHQVYFGQIVNILGVEKYNSKNDIK